jgi:hypothetical protein
MRPRRNFVRGATRHHVQVDRHCDPVPWEHGGVHECTRAAQADLFGIERSEHHRMPRRVSDEMASRCQQHGDTRRVVIRSGVEDAVANAKMIVMCRDHQ